MRPQHRRQPYEGIDAYRGAVNLPDVLSLARSLMEQADVGDWDLAFDRARRRPAKQIMRDVVSHSAATS